MSTASITTNPFDLCRVSKSKREVDLSPNTIRAYATHGLQIYRVGKAAFFSRSQLANLITSGVIAVAMQRAAKKGDVTT
jgi:hypothetical protein